MRNDTLPSPGRLSMGIALQSTMAKAISAVEISGGITANGGKTALAKQLDTFLVAARTAIASFIDAVVPTLSSRTVGTVPKTPFAETAQVVRLRFNKELDRGFLPPTTAFTMASPAKVVQSVAIDGPDVLITVTVPYVSTDAPTVAYVLPGTIYNVRDLSGNLAATFTAAAIVNTVAA